MPDAAVWGTVGQWVGAIGTVLAVCVALFKDEWVRAKRRPRLHVVVALAAPHCHKTTIGPITVQKVAPTIVFAGCYYLRLWIENRGKTRAEQVQVFLAGVLRKQEDGSFLNLTTFLPMNLRWSHGRPDGSTEIYAEGIAPGMGKHCDLLRLVDPEFAGDFEDELPSLGTGLTVGVVQLEMFPNNRAHILGPGVYRVSVRVAAANAPPADTTLELEITGKWFDDEQRMFDEGVGLKAL